MFDIYQLDRGLTNCLFEKLKLIWWFIKCFVRQISSLRHQIVDLLRAIPKARVETKFPSCQQYLTQELHHSWGPDRHMLMNTASYHWSCGRSRRMKDNIWEWSHQHSSKHNPVGSDDVHLMINWWLCIVCVYSDKCELSWQVLSSMNL